MTKQDKIKKILSEVTGVLSDDILDEHKLKDDLDISVVDRSIILLELEADFGVSINEYIFNECEQVRDLYPLV